MADTLDQNTLICLAEEGALGVMRMLIEDELHSVEHDIEHENEDIEAYYRLQGEAEGLSTALDFIRHTSGVLDLLVHGEEGQ